MYKTPGTKYHYRRPASAASFRNVGEMLIGHDLDAKKIAIRLSTTLTELGANSYAHFAESTDTNGKPLVICSGMVHLIGAATGGNYVGITVKDAVPGERVMAYTEGDFWLPFDHKGDSGNSINPGDILGDLTGMTAYWNPGREVVSNVDQGGLGIIVGEFLEGAVLQPPGLPWMLYAVKVRIRPVKSSTAAVFATTAPTNAYKAVAAPMGSDVNGLTVSLTANVINNAPNEAIANAQISWTIDGTPDVIIGESGNYTASGEGAETFSIIVTRPDNSTYTVGTGTITFANNAAPVIAFTNNN